MEKLKNLLTIRQLSYEQILGILKLAQARKIDLLSGKKSLDILSNKNVATLFYENSTRTKNSFENAAKFLGASVTSLDVATSSVQKGESLGDTGKTIEALKADAIVIRHSIAGTPVQLQKQISIPVINAGDGLHAHPTQALLDAMTIKEYKKSFNGLNVLIVGDIKHSRVAMSNIECLHKLGANVEVIGPKTLVPECIRDLNIKSHDNIENAMRGKDVVIGLRIQLERQQAGLFPSIKEYVRNFQINHERIALAKNDVILIHPGPVNIGVEISKDLVEDIKYSKIVEQVTNGLCVRMALLQMILGGNK